MTPGEWVAGAVGIALIVYLTYALLFPERF